MQALSVQLILYHAGWPERTMIGLHCSAKGVIGSPTLSGRRNRVLSDRGWKTKQAVLFHQVVLVGLMNKLVKLHHSTEMTASCKQYR